MNDSSDQPRNKVAKKGLRSAAQPVRAEDLQRGVAKPLQDKLSAAVPGRNAQDQRQARPVDRAASAGTTTTPPATKAKEISEDQIMAWLGVTDLMMDSPATKRAANAARGPRKPRGEHPVTDAAILSLVGDRLMQRGIPSFARIGLDISSGAVTVRGTVASKGERLLLIQILQSTPGVTKVVDGLTISRPRRQMSMPSLQDWAASWAGSIPSVTGPFESLKPVHAAAVAAILLIGGLIYFVPWPKSRPLAVYPVKGRVVIDNEPLAKASIVLHPIGKTKLPNGVQPRAVANQSGGFEVGTFAAADGAPEGEFIATVFLFEPIVVDGDSIAGPNLLPAIYSKPETSPFKVKITRDTKELSLLALHKPNKNSSNRN